MKKKMTVMAVAAGMAIGAFAATTADYVQDGLLVHLDGIDNENTGTHNASATRWKAIKGSTYVNLQSDASWVDGKYLDTTPAQHVLTGMPAYKRAELGLIQVPEGRKLFPNMSVYENLQVGSYLKGPRAARKESMEFCFELFPKMYERRHQLAGSLSGGERQMCAMCRALMQKPKLLMLDEPSLGLAPVVVQSVFESIVRINKMGMTILLVEQNVHSSLAIADKGFVIETGQNTISGPAAELRGNEELQRAYLGI